MGNSHKVKMDIGFNIMILALLSIAVLGLRQQWRNATTTDVPTCRTKF